MKRSYLTFCIVALCSPSNHSIAHHTIPESIGQRQALPPCRQDTALYGPVRGDGDTLINNDRGISLSSTPMQYGLICEVSANSLFSYWNDTLILKLMGETGHPLHLTIVLTRQRTHQRYHISFPEITGKVTMTLTRRSRILSYQVIHVPHFSA